MKFKYDKIFQVFNCVDFTKPSYSFLDSGAYTPYDYYL